MAFPAGGSIGDVWQDSAPTAVEIEAVRFCQGILRRNGMHYWADNLATALTRPEFVLVENGWLLSAEAANKAKVEAEKLLGPAPRI